MNKTELIAAIAAKADLSKKDAEKALVAMTETIVEEIGKGEKVQIVGFARKGINPLTKAPIESAACTVPAFKAGKAFKDAVK